MYSMVSIMPLSLAFWTRVLIDDPVNCDPFENPFTLEATSATTMATMTMSEHDFILVYVLL
jgi:hypothetical protein